MANMQLVCTIGIILALIAYLATMAWIVSRKSEINWEDYDKKAAITISVKPDGSDDEGLMPDAPVCD